MSEFQNVPYRFTRAYRDACKAAAAQRARMTYRVASVEHVRGITASAVCRRV
jgi:hypothetical protein